MKNRIGVLTILCLSLAGSLTLVIAQSQRRDAGFVFESEPRAVMALNGEGVSRHAKLALRTTNFYMLTVYGADRSQSQLGLAVSNDWGDSFEPIVPISEPGVVVSSHGENSPSLAINGIEFYALWEQNATNGETDLMFARSLRFGRKFDKPVRVTDKTTPSQNGFSYLATAQNGDLYAVWLDGRDPQHTAPGTSHVYLAKSTDKGATWSKNIAIADNVCPCCRPAIAFGAGGEVYVAWRGVDAGDVRDMMLAVSTDNGATFGKSVLMANDNWKISGCPHTGPQLVTKGKRLYAAWHSDGDSKNAGIRVVWSDDNGRSFSKPVIASGAVNDTNHPTLSLSEDGRLLLVFQGREPAEKEGWGPVRAFLTEVYDSGTVSAPSVIPGSRKTVQFPAVVAGTVGRVFVAWTESTDKGVQVMLSRGRKGNKATISASATAKSKAVRTTRPASAEVERQHQH
jgi:BNR repeat-like domain